MTYHAYLPVISNPQKTFPGKMLGVYIPDEMHINEVIQYVPKGGLIQFTVYWDRIELSRGNYTWYLQLDLNLQALHTNSNRFILNIKCTPEWARKYSGYSTSPPKPENYQDFANFVSSLISHCGNGVYAVSLFNEPDTVRQELASDWRYFGAWIESSNPSQGGADYASMTKIVVPYLKSHHPSVFVHVGELMYTTHKHFLQDAVNNGLVGDILSFHVYPRWDWKAQYGTTEQELLDWAHSQFISSIMAITSMPLFMGEIALLYSNSSDTEARKFQADFYEYQKDRIVWDWISVVGFIWFFLGGNHETWENSEMIDNSDVKKPVYNIYYKFMLQQGGK